MSSRTANPCDERGVRYLVLVLLIARVASAHQSSTKYLDVAITGDHAELALRFVPGDVTEPMKLRPDAKPSVDAAASAPAVAGYVARWVVVRGCTTANASARAGGDGFVVVAWTVTCPTRIHELALDFTPFFSLDAKMEMFVRTAGSDGSLRVIAAAPALTLALDDAPLDGMRDAFTITRLVFLALIALVGARNKRPWRVTTILLAAYLCAFLIGAATGIALDPMLGTAIVGVTMVYTAAEVISRPDWRWRTATFAAFGIVHGVVHGSTLMFNIVSAGVACALTFAVLLPLTRLVVARIVR